MTRPGFDTSDAARAQIVAVREQRGLEEHAIRIKIHDLAGRRYSLQFVPLNDRQDSDCVVEDDGLVFFLDARTAECAEGATLDYVDDLQGSGFKLDNPDREPFADNPLAGRVQEVIDSRVNPAVEQHGGVVILLDVRDRRVFLEFGGGCRGCGMIDVTLKEGVAKMIQEEIPEIVEVLDTTDHASGSNPYFRQES